LGCGNLECKRATEIDRVGYGRTSTNDDAAAPCTGRRCCLFSFAGDDERGSASASGVETGGAAAAFGASAAVFGQGQVWMRSDLRWICWFVCCLAVDLSFVD
jgi:hypothetical protein